MKREPCHWKTEAELCADFTELARADGWTVYPENDFDMLLVKGNVQIGVEAKLRPNVAVLRQAAAPLCHWYSAIEEGAEGVCGPDFLAVLVPWHEADFMDVARLCGVTVLNIDRRKAYGKHRQECGIKTQIVPSLPCVEFFDVTSRSAWIPHYFQKPCWIPPYVPDLPAGVPAPVSLTQWKVEAVRLCVLLRRQGFITTTDIKAAGLSPTYFTQHLLEADGKIGRLYRYVARPGVKLPDEDHPEVAARMREEPFVPRDSIELATQESLIV